MIDLKKPLDGVPGLLLLAALVLFGAVLGVAFTLMFSWVDVGGQGSIEIDHGTGKVIYDLVLGIAIGGLTGVVAGFVVDAMTERRERRRWQPVTNLYYVDILRALDRLLFHSVPHEFKVENDKYCVFGSGAYLKLSFEPSDENIFWTALGWASLYLERFDTDPPPVLPHLGLPLGLGPVSEVTSKLQKLIGLYGPLREPQLSAMTSDLIINAESCQRFEKADIDWSDEGTRLDCFKSLVIFLHLADDLRKRVISHGTLTTEEPDWRQKELGDLMNFPKG